MKLKKWVYAGLFAIMCLCATTSVLKASEDNRQVYSLLTGQIDNQYPVTGIVNYDLNSPATFEMVHEISNGNSLGAGVMVDGVFYWFEYLKQVYGYDSVGLYAYDTEDNSVRLVQSYGNAKAGVCFSSPTYDYQTKTVYALEGLIGGGDLVSVDLESGNVSKLIPFTGLLKNEEYNSDDSMKAIAINYDGDMYGVSYWGRLYKINQVSGECTMVADLDFNPEKAIMYSTSLAFDNDTNELYWHVYTWVNLYNEVRRINIQDGTTEQVGIFADNRLMGDFHIPFTVAAAGAPAKVADLTVSPDPEGGNGATISWTNPSRTYGRGGTLESLQKVEIYRNNELLATIDNPTIGGDESWHDDVPSADLYSYKVIPYNETGKGDRSAVTIFVGQGIPMPVTDLRLSPCGHGAKIEWTAPDHGKFDAYLDKESLCFDITRSDGKIVATDYKETSFNDSDIETLALYSYSVKAKNIGGESVEITSNAQVCGPSVEIPATFSFETIDDFNLWTVIDGNGDESTWVHSSWPIGAKSYFSYIYQYPAHDYLISPKIIMKAGKHYKVTFDALPSNKNVTEVIAVSFGPEASPSQQDSIAQYEFRSNGLKTFRTSLPAVKTDGEFNLGFIHRSVEPNFGLTISNIRIEEDHDGSIEGLVSCDGAPVPGATIATTDGLYSTVSDNDGRYLLQYLPAEKYDLSVSAFGFEGSSLQAEVAELSTITHNLELIRLPQYSIKGTVIDTTGEPVSDATVSLGGSGDAKTHTDSSGQFEIDGIFRHDSYSLVIERNNLLSYNATLDIDRNLDCGTIILKDNLKSPYKVTVDSFDESALVKWQSPLGDPREIRFDDGVFNISLGISTANGNSVFGHVNRTPSVLYGCSFFLMSTVDIPDHYSVYFYVLDLDKNGNPTGDVLYRNTYVPVTDDEWTDFTLPTPIDCPNGYMAGIAYGGFISLAVDGEGDKEAWPFQPNVNCFTSDYTSGEWTYLDQTDFKRNFAFRTVAAPYGEDSANPLWIKSSHCQGSDSPLLPESYMRAKPAAEALRKAPMKVLEERIRYNVYRSENNAATDDIEWKELSSGIKGNSYNDSEWKSLPQGVYRYGVRAVYADNEMSELTLCNSIGKNMLATLTVSAMTDTPINEIEGAVLSLSSSDGEFTYSGTFGADGYCVIENIWKSQYRLSITQNGFGTVEDEVNMTTENTYLLHYNMLENRAAPANLRAIYETDDDSSPLIIWNFPDIITEGFEEHDDFTINSPGNLGWQYIDGDGMETGAFMGYEWPGIFQPMAFMVFNPYNTTPASTDFGIYPYEGNKILADFAAYGAANDDWIISPRLYFPDDFKLAFYARSFNYATPETIQVGYSETGYSPEDFIWVADKEVIDNSYWMEFSYDFPASAKYVAIHCISDQCSIFMLDNLRMGLPMAFESGYNAPMKRPSSESAYEVFLDGNKIATTNNTQFQFTRLLPGCHTIGVRSAYTSGYSTLSAIDINVSESGVQTVAGEESCISLENRTLHIYGPHKSISIQTVPGIVVKTGDNTGTHDLSDLPSGIYVISVNSTDRTVNFKINLR